MARQRQYPMSRRNALAQARGFASYGQQRRFSSNVDNRQALEALPPGAREARQDSLDVLAVARREGIDVATAAGRLGVSVDSVAWWAGNSLRGGKAAAADRMFRPMYVYSAGQVVPVDVRGSRVASTIGAYHSAVQHYLSRGDASRLGAFSGKRVGGVELETDLDVIDELARRGEFDFESLYRMVEA